MESICYVCGKPGATPGPDGVPRCEECAAAYSAAVPLLPEGWNDSVTDDDDDWEEDLQESADEVWRGMCRK